jgi:large subunit ribosomal protein L9
MEIILLQKINKLGNMGDTVQVKPGFGRNYLIPTGKALRATKENKEIFEKSKAKLLKENKEAITTAEKLRQEVQKLDLRVVRSASDTGILYGSVTTRDIANLIVDNGVNVTKKQIALEKPIKDLGVFEISVVLHPEVESRIQLKVVRSLSQPTSETEDISNETISSDETNSAINESLLEDGVKLQTEDNENEQDGEVASPEDEQTGADKTE